MDLKSLTERVSEAIKDSDSFADSVAFDFGADGRLHVDGKSKDVSNDVKDADVTIRVSMADFKRLAQRELDPMSAFMHGKLKVTGDIGVAMRLQTLFSQLG